MSFSSFDDNDEDALGASASRGRACVATEQLLWLNTTKTSGASIPSKIKQAPFSKGTDPPPPGENMDSQDGDERGSGGGGGDCGIGFIEGVGVDHTDEEFLSFLSYLSDALPETLNWGPFRMVAVLLRVPPP
ncbi:hypothetical protein ACHAW5_006369 [Stephanodiscus triporus]|uniref:Uncharacterized protein n=1 Tax=Stephanodiscus triporus TaxID=2934178 RepID=A0ABD3MDQ3_9STRA